MPRRPHSIERATMPYHMRNEAPSTPADPRTSRSFVQSHVLRISQKSSRAPNPNRPSPCNIDDRDPDGTTTTVIGDLPPHMFDRTPRYDSPTEPAARYFHPNGTTRPTISSPLMEPTLVNSASTSTISFSTGPTCTAMMGRTGGRWNNDNYDPQYWELRTSGQSRLPLQPGTGNGANLSPTGQSQVQASARSSALGSVSYQDATGQTWSLNRNGTYSIHDDILYADWSPLPLARAMEQEERSSFRRGCKRKGFRGRLRRAVDAVKRCRFLCG